MPTDITVLPISTKKASDQSSHIVIGARLSIAKTDTGIKTMLPATTFDRFIVIYGQATEVFAETTGTMTSFKIGQTGTDDKFGDTAGVSNVAFGVDLSTLTSIVPSVETDNRSCIGILSANCALIVTVTPAVGDGTGGVDLAIMAFA